ncbi:MAG: DUF4167 domain-containing protein [Pseudomonadota bacterium]
MRSSKNRSRSKGNRNRSVGNIVNRVFDSSGPEGKVRGTPQQIIDKYNQLARDAQLSNDRVAGENFQQHAEHYTRLLSEAQKEMEARREIQEQQNQQRRDRQNHDQQPGFGDAPQPSNGDSQPQPEAAADPAASNGFDDVIDSGGASSGADIVETPEEQPKPRKSRRRKQNGADAKPEPAADAAPEPAADQEEQPTTPPEAAAE